jgi:hypothetical protein
LELAGLRSPASSGGRFDSFALFVGTSVPLWHLLLIGQAYCRRQCDSLAEVIMAKEMVGFASPAPSNPMVETAGFANRKYASSNLAKCKQGL